MKTAMTLGGGAAADEPRVLTDAQLDQVTAGLLLPAVQKVREAAARMDTQSAAGAETLRGVSNRLEDFSLPAVQKR